MELGSKGRVLSLDCCRDDGGPSLSLARKESDRSVPGALVLVISRGLRERRRSCRRSCSSRIMRALPERRKKMKMKEWQDTTHSGAG